VHVGTRTHLGPDTRKERRVARLTRGLERAGQADASVKVNAVKQLQAHLALAGPGDAGLTGRRSAVEGEVPVAQHCRETTLPSARSRARVAPRWSRRALRQRRSRAVRPMRSRGGSPPGRRDPAPLPFTPHRPPPSPGRPPRPRATGALPGTASLQRLQQLLH
jgi:hypothetical protein